MAAAGADQHHLDRRLDRLHMLVSMRIFARAFAALLLLCGAAQAQIWQGGGGAGTPSTPTWADVCTVTADVIGATGTACSGVTLGTGLGMTGATLNQTLVPNAQSGASYTILSTDANKI